MHAFRRTHQRMHALLLLLALLGPLLLRPALLAHSVAHADSTVGVAQLESKASPHPISFGHVRGDALCHWFDHQLAACDAPLPHLPAPLLAQTHEAPRPSAALHHVDLAHRGPQARDPPRA
jgi:hypothetical protein